ncbi:MAG: PhzF family phenazine biosynthesis protein, partial [Oscillospiraceae bacterium]|nr:PhzF family phenazine biosynthesis protein [Oscillospiraceae bacterium]
NNLSETAFVLKQEDHYDLRWFTPAVEVDLCGHATLGTAYVIANFVDTDVTEMSFHTRSGILTVTRDGGLYTLNFPARMPLPLEVVPLMSQAVGCPVLEAHLARDMVLVVENEQQVRDLSVNMSLISKLADFSVIVTAPGDNIDFVSRFFGPNVGVPEDPVTGSAHATLVPFWGKRLGKDKMTAMQLSMRGGTIYCENCGDRVKLSGKAVLYLQGEISV